MQAIQFQSSNILENFYTDGIFSYIMTPSIANMPHQFQSIITFCNTYIPSWKPTYKDPRNRLIYNNEFLFELLFYKNLILVIPLYISSTGSKFDSSIAHIKSYCHKLTNIEDGLDVSLAKLLDYKFIFYSPIMIPGHYNIFKTMKTVIKTELHMEMYQSVPITLNNTPIVAGLPTYENITSNVITNNPLYTPYKNYSQKQSNPTPMDTK
jgi:hypothetical protein